MTLQEIILDIEETAIQRAAFVEALHKFIDEQRLCFSFLKTLVDDDVLFQLLSILYLIGTLEFMCCIPRKVERSKETFEVVCVNCCSVEENLVVFQSSETIEACTSIKFKINQIAFDHVFRFIDDKDGFGV